MAYEDNVDSTIINVDSTAYNMDSSINTNVNPDGADLQSVTYLSLFSFCNLATQPQNISMTAENSVRKYPKKNNFTTSLASTTSLVSIGISGNSLLSGVASGLVLSAQSQETLSSGRRN